MKSFEIFLNSHSSILSNPVNVHISLVFLMCFLNEDPNKVHMFQSVDMSLRSHNLQVSSPSLFFLAIYLLEKLSGLSIELTTVYILLMVSLCGDVQHSLLSPALGSQMQKVFFFFGKTTSLMVMCLFQDAYTIRLSGGFVCLFCNVSSP